MLKQLCNNFMRFHFFLYMKTGSGKKLLTAVRSGNEEAAFSVFVMRRDVQSTQILSDQSI